MSRFILIFLLVAACFPARAAHIANPDLQIKIAGSVDDPSGATVYNAKVELLDNNGGLIASTTTLINGQFQVAAPPGNYQLAVIHDGFATSVSMLHVRKAPGAPLLVRLKMAEVNQQVNVYAFGGEKSTDPTANKDSTTLTTEDLRNIPIFDNDYIAALSTLLDTGDVSTAGTTILVDGVEKNRVGAPLSAVQSVSVNNDPYSAEFYQPGRGQMQITTKAAADSFHGSLNFNFRDGIFNARYPFSPPGQKPSEQRRIYSGDFTGPIFRLKATAFLFSFTEAEENVQAIVNATVPAGYIPAGSGYTITQGTSCPVACDQVQANVAAPTRNTEIAMRASRQLSPAQSAYLEYQFQDQSDHNEDVGDFVLATAGYDIASVENDFILHDDYALSPTRLNQLAVLVETNRQDQTNVNQGPTIAVQGAFVAGGAQNQQVKSEYNLRLTDSFSYTEGSHQMKFGVNLPHIDRRILEDESLFGGRYVFSGLAAFRANTASTYEFQQGQSRYLYHDLESGIYALDVIQVSPTLTITPGLRYDWNNFTQSLADFSPRLSIAKLLDKDSATVLRIGSGVYYDRAGTAPLADIGRYDKPYLFDILLTDSPCYPALCPGQVTTLAPNVVRLAPNIRTPLHFNFSASLERRLTKTSTVSMGYRNMHIYDAYRSVDINAPLPFSGSFARPDPSYGRYRQIQSAGESRTNEFDLGLHGRLGVYFSGAATYAYAHAINNTSGIASYPQNQYAPASEEGSADYDQRHRLNLLGIFGEGKPLNLGMQLHIFAGAPYTITTGTDPYGTGFFNARPVGVARNSQNKPTYRDVDLRYNYDFKLHPKKQDKSPTVGFALSAYNVINTLNGSTVSSVITSPTFGHVIAALPPRRMELELRYSF